MRILALTVVVFGVAVLGGAQTLGQTTPTLFRANTIQIATDGQAIQLRGDVQIQVGDVDMRADEVDVASGSLGATREITLRGNVRVRLAAPPADQLAFQLAAEATRQNNRR